MLHTTFGRGLIFENFQQVDAYEAEHAAEKAQLQTDLDNVLAGL